MSILANAKSKICQEKFTKLDMNATAAGNKKVMPEKVRGTLKVKKVMEMKTLQKVMMTDMSWRLRKSTLGSARPYHRKRLALWSSCDALCNVTCWVLPLWRGRPQISAWGSRRSFCLAVAGRVHFFMILWGHQARKSPRVFILLGFPSPLGGSVPKGILCFLEISRTCIYR